MPFEKGVLFPLVCGNAADFAATFDWLAALSANQSNSTGKRVRQHELPFHPSPAKTSTRFYVGRNC